MYNQPIRSADRLLISFGVVFELPVVIMILASLGIAIGFTEITAANVRQGAQRMMGSLGALDPIRKLANIQTPTLVVHSELDPIPAEWSRFLAAVIPHAEFHFGGWYPVGGMYRLAEELERLGARLGNPPTIVVPELEGRGRPFDPVRFAVGAGYTLGALLHFLALRRVKAQYVGSKLFTGGTRCWAI